MVKSKHVVIICDILFTLTKPNKAIKIVRFRSLGGTKGYRFLPPYLSR